MTDRHVAEKRLVSMIDGWSQRPDHYAMALGYLRQALQEERQDERERIGGVRVNGELLVELAAREAGRRTHKNWRRVSAGELAAVLDDLGFRIEITA